MTSNLKRNTLELGSFEASKERTVITMLENINYIELLAAGVSAMVVGFVWYSMQVFGKTWLKEVGLTQADMKEGMKDMPKTYGLMYVGALVQAYVLSILLSVFGAADYMAAAQVAFWAWLGFVATVKLGDVLFERRSWTYWGINAGYQLVTMVVMSAVLVTL